MWAFSCQVKAFISELSETQRRKKKKKGKVDFVSVPLMEPLTWMSGSLYSTMKRNPASVLKPVKRNVAKLAWTTRRAAPRSRGSASANQISRPTNLNGDVWLDGDEERLVIGGGGFRVYYRGSGWRSVLLGVKLQQTELNGGRGRLSVSWIVVGSIPVFP